MHKKIKLAPDYKKSALVDADVYDELVDMGTWRLHEDGYAVLHYYVKKVEFEPMSHSNRIHKMVRMHRIIMGVSDPRIEIDHIKGNRLDNRREKLRKCNRQQNARNSKKRSDNKSGHTGIIWDKSRDKWMAYAKEMGKMVYLGRFTKKKDAIVARSKYETEVYGKFTRR